MKKLLPITILPILAFTSCNDKNQDVNSTRYSTSTFSVAGGMAVVTQITDHQENKIYYYKLSDKKGLTLQNTIDLSQCGAQNIPFDKVETAE